MKTTTLILSLALTLSACGSQADTATVTDTGVIVDPVPADSDNDGFNENEDCNDADSSVYPGATDAPYDGVDSDCAGDDDFDVDQDGFIPDGYESIYTGSLPAGDCDDSNNSTYPDATDAPYDGVDSNCDGSFDYDVDGDGYAPSDYKTECLDANTLNGTNFDCELSDCDDTNADFHPGAEERCDDIDTDCDGQTMDFDSIDATSFYVDADNDGFGIDQLTTACAQGDLAGVSTSTTDCDDAKSDVYPGAPEQCGGIDHDCDGLVNEDNSIDVVSYFVDADGDGFGSDQTQSVCVQTNALVTVSGDCDDSSTGAAINPDATEVCDGVDNDCDSVIDGASATDRADFYVDTDGDGFGTDATQLACSAGDGLVAQNGDCDDSSTGAAINPDATEVCDGVDNDCDTLVDEPDAADAISFYVDNDRDSYGTDQVQKACAISDGLASQSGDCDDSTATGMSIYPGATEICDSVDNDCDGIVDGPLATDATNFFVDNDGDTYGSDQTQKACTAGNGLVAQGGDCDDSTATGAAIHPGVTEICDDLDNDCDGVIDGPKAIGARTLYVDNDGDGFGSTTSQQACSVVPGLSATNDDCDDSSSGAAINPAALEVCDSIDNDCNTVVDDPNAWSSPHAHRIPVAVDGATVPTTQSPVMLNVDFAQALVNASDLGTFDPASLQLRPESCGAAVPVQFEDGLVSLLDKVSSTDPLNDAHGTVAFLFDTDGDWATAETLASGARQTYYLYFDTVAAAQKPLVAPISPIDFTAGLFSNGPLTGLLDDGNSGLLAMLEFADYTGVGVGLGDFGSQVGVSTGNGFYVTGPGWTSFSSATAVNNTVLANGPVFGAVKAAGSIAEADYAYTYIAFAQQPVFYAKVFAQATADFSTAGYDTDDRRPFAFLGLGADNGTATDHFAYASTSTWNDVSYLSAGGVAFGTSYGFLHSLGSAPDMGPATAPYAVGTTTKLYVTRGSDQIGFIAPVGTQATHTVLTGDVLFDHPVAFIMPHAGDLAANQQQVTGMLEGLTASASPVQSR